MAPRGKKGGRSSISDSTTPVAQRRGVATNLRWVTVGSKAGGMRHVRPSKQRMVSEEQHTSCVGDRQMLYGESRCLPCVEKEAHMHVTFLISEFSSFIPKSVENPQL